MLESFIKTMELKVSNHLKALTSKAKGMSSASPVSKGIEPFSASLTVGQDDKHLVIPQCNFFTAF